MRSFRRSWAQTEAAKGVLYTSRREAQRGGWSAPERLDLEGSGDAFGPRIALDQTGNALAILSTQTVEHRQVWTARYDASKHTWQGAQAPDAGDFDAYGPTLAITRDGHAVAAWTHEEPSRLGPYTSTCDADDRTWSPPSALESEADARAEFVALALTSEGRALAVWSRNGKTLAASHLR
jgi:hypothetical protein